MSDGIPVLPEGKIFLSAKDDNRGWGTTKRLGSDDDVVRSMKEDFRALIGGLLAAEL